MAELSAEGAEVNARILYWGAEGAGKSANLLEVSRKLRSDHRGELRSVTTRVDPSVHYEVLPIELGEVAGMRVQIHLVAVPGGAEQVPTRTQLLDRADGVVFVVDARPDHMDANLASFEELRSALSAYGRGTDEIPLVVQYNKRDLSDAYTLEELHRKLDLHGTPAFEAVASNGMGVLQTLTTISKSVIRHLRDHGADVLPPLSPPPPEPEPEPAPEPVRTRALPEASPTIEIEPPSERMETPSPSPALAVEAALLAEQESPEAAAENAAVAAEAESLLDSAWPGEPTIAVEPGAGVTIETVGRATVTDEGGVRVPLVLRDADGRRRSLALCIRFEAPPDAPET